MTCATCILSCDSSEPDVTTNQPAYLSFDGNGHMESTIGIEAAADYNGNLDMTKVVGSEQQTSDDVGQIGSYDDQMISVSIRILLRRGTGDIKAAIELKASQKLEELENPWRALENTNPKFRGSSYKMDTSSCGSLEKERMQTWKHFQESDLLEEIFYQQIAMSNKCFESENIFVCTCKTFFVAADLYISLPSQRKHFSSAEKQIAKVQPVCDLNIFPQPDKVVKFSCSAEERAINLQLKNRFLSTTPADPFVRSAALQWVDRQTGTYTYQPHNPPQPQPQPNSLQVERLDTRPQPEPES